MGTGVEIGTLTVTDPDASGNNNVLTVSDTSNFKIENNKLIFIGTSPDFETKASYSVTVTSTDGSLVKSQAFTINVSNVNEAPQWQTSALSGVTNFDVASNLVFTSDKALKVGTGSIRILDENAAFSRTGFRTDTNDNDQTIDVTTALANGLISLSADKKTITINPKWDLDLSSNYKIIIDDGAFVSETGGLKASALEVSFATVTPGTGTLISQAVASSKMNAAGGLDADNRLWFDLESVNNDITGNIAQLGSLKDKAYVLVSKNYQEIAGDPTPGDGDPGVTIKDLFVGVTEFGVNDQIYFDAQLNDATKQVFHPQMIPGINDAADIASDAGGIAGQNVLSWVEFMGGQSWIALGLEGNTNNTIYDYIYKSDAAKYSDSQITYTGMFDIDAKGVIMG